MNFKNISIIIALLYLNSKAISSPMNKVSLEVEQSMDEISGSEGEEVLSTNDLDIEVEVSDGDEVVLVTEDSESSMKEEVSEITFEDTEECLTQECFEASKRILTNLDITANPCDNFYQFACGGWMNENELTDNEYYIGTFKDIDDRNQIILKEILEGDYPVNENLSEMDQKLDRELFNKLKTLYSTCMDTDSINQKGKEPFMKFLRQFDIDKTMKKDYKNVDTLTELLADLHDYNINVFFGLSVEVSLEDNQVYMMGFGEAPTVFDKSYFENPLYIPVIKDIVQSILSPVFGDQPDHDIEEMTELIINFEEKLANILVPADQLQIISDYYHKSTIGEFNEKYPSVNWTLYFQKRFEAAGVKMEITNNTVVINATPTYFEGLNKLLVETDVDTLVAYVEWYAIQNYIIYVSDDVNKPFKDFKNALIGSTGTPRYLECINYTNTSMQMALGRYFVEKTFDENKKEGMEEVVKYIKEAMIERIPRMEWLDQKTKENALKKASTLYEVIGFPDYLLNPVKLVEQYRDLILDSENHFVNMVHQNQYNVHERLRNMDRPTDKQKWTMGPQEANAYYDFMFNSFNLLEGILQPPFYKAGQPDYLNYGGIGSVVGHELTHGFDKSGKDFDAHGRLSNWWSEYSYNKFEEYSQCFIDQYNQFYIENENGEKFYGNGLLAINENLADNGGLARAYEAWKISQRENPEKFEKRNKSLPGLSDYTQDQLFFIAYGQVWCDQAKFEFYLNNLYSNAHALGQFRVNGVVSNSPTFAEMFHCPTHASMNPEKKCSIW